MSVRSQSVRQQRKTAQLGQVRHLECQSQAIAPCHAPLTGDARADSAGFTAALRCADAASSFASIDTAAGAADCEAAGSSDRFEPDFMLSAAVSFASVIDDFMVSVKTGFTLSVEAGFELSSKSAFKASREAAFELSSLPFRSSASLSSWACTTFCTGSPLLMDLTPCCSDCCRQKQRFFDRFQAVDRSHRFRSSRFPAAASATARGV